MFHWVYRASSLFAISTCAAAVWAASASAAVTISYISTTGSNKNPCTAMQPCRMLQYAIGQTAAGGEVRILGSGFYGNKATIRRSITISGNGYTVILDVPITIAGAAAVVTLRNLVLDGGGTTLHGIRIDAAAAVHIEHCVVQGFVQRGILQTNTARTRLFVNDTIARDNGFAGLDVNGKPALASVTVDNSRFENNGSYGLYVVAIRGTVTRTVASGNGTVGFVAAGPPAARLALSRTVATQNGSGYVISNGSRMTIDSSLAHGNTYGLFTHDTDDKVWLSRSVITNNDYGVYISTGGKVWSLQTNTFAGNATADVFGTLTPLSPM